MAFEGVRRAKGRQKGIDQQLTGTVLRYLFGLGGSVLLCWLLLYIVARIMCSVDVPLTWIVPITTGCSALAVLLGAWGLAASAKKNGALWGGALALGCWAILSVCGMLLKNPFTQLTLLRLLTFVCAGMIGGILGVYLSERRRKKRPGAR